METPISHNPFVLHFVCLPFSSDVLSCIKRSTIFVGENNSPYCFIFYIVFVFFYFLNMYAEPTT